MRFCVTCRRKILAVGWAVMALLAVAAAPPLAAQTIQPPYNASYTFTSLGSVPGLPPLYGGLTFLLGDPNTIIIGGNANTVSGALYSIGVVRGPQNHITGFTGSVAPFAQGAYNDGGVVYGPGNVLFLTRYPVNQIGENKFGSTTTDKIVSLAPLGVVASPGALNFVPGGFPGAGLLKIVSWPGGQWYTAAFSPDGSGTYDITSATLNTTITGGPEGFIYVPPGSPLFPSFSSLLVSEYSAGSIAAYQVDAGGNPIVATRATFMSGLTGAEGAAIDPVTGDFLFSTFGGGNQVVVVQGFAIPPPPTPPGPTPTPTTTPPVAPAAVPTLSFPLLVLLGALVAGIGLLLTRRS